jgi:hypothetical protein
VNSKVKVKVSLPYSFYNLGDFWGGWSTSRPDLSPFPGIDHVFILYEAGWAPGPVWTGGENYFPPGFDTRTFQPGATRNDYGIPIQKSKSLNGTHTNTHTHKHTHTAISESRFFSHQRKESSANERTEVN